MIFTTRVRTPAGTRVKTVVHKALDTVWKTEFDLRIMFMAHPQFTVETHDQDGHLVAVHTHHADGTWAGPFEDPSANDGLDAEDITTFKSTTTRKSVTTQCSHCKKRWRLAVDDSGICPHCGGVNG